MCAGVLFAQKNWSVWEETGVEKLTTMKRAVSQYQPYDYKEFLLVACVALGLVGLIATRTEFLLADHPAFNNPWDHHKYIWMATEATFDFHIAPFCWRIGLPALVKIMPLPVQWNFILITVISIWLTGVMIYYLVKVYHRSPSYDWIAMLIYFSSGWATKAPLVKMWLPDALSFCLSVLIFYCIITQKAWWFAGLLLIGVTVKESALFMAPLYYTFSARTLFDIKVLKRWVLLILPAILTLIAIRMAIPALNDNPTYLQRFPETLRFVQRESSSYHYGQLFKQVVQERLQDLSFHALNRYTVGTFGVLAMLLPFFAIRENARLLVRVLPFLGLVYAQLLFAVNTERLLIAGLPAIIVLAVNGVKTLVKVLNIPVISLAGLPVVLMGLNLLRLSEVSASVDMQALVFILYVALLCQYTIWRKSRSSSYSEPSI
jgi:hypothetical protein